MSRHDTRNPYPFHDAPRYDADRAARMAAAVAKHDARKAHAERVNRWARRAVFALVALACVAVFYVASEPGPDLGRYDAMRGPAVIASGLSIGACVDMMTRDVATACERVR